MTIHPVLRKEKDTQTNKYNLFLETHVIDQGIGISRKQLKKLNMPPTFANICNRGPNLTKNIGFGLGLTTARILAKAQNGNLTIESTEGMGTTVTLNIQVYKSKSRLLSNDLLHVPKV